MYPKNATNTDNNWSEKSYTQKVIVRIFKISEQQNYLHKIPKISQYKYMYNNIYNCIIGIGICSQNNLFF